MTRVMSRVAQYVYSTSLVRVLYVYCIHTVRVTAYVLYVSLHTYCTCTAYALYVSLYHRHTFCPDSVLLYGGTVRAVIPALHEWLFRLLYLHDGELMDGDGGGVQLYVPLSGTVYARWEDPIAWDRTQI